jgi:cytochrome c oxidase subunit 3
MTALAPAATTHAAEATTHRKGIGTPVLGMLLFITSEVMFFAGLFAAYFSIRGAAAEWPPAELDGVLKIFPLVGPATVLLIISSFTGQLGLRAIRRGNRTAFIRYFAVTLGLGLVFLVLQGIDYAILYSEGMTLDAGAYGTTYYTLTGFHGAHVIGGVLMLGVVLYRGMAGQFSARHYDAPEAALLYWDFVDIVWIVLFTILYLVPLVG